MCVCVCVCVLHCVNSQDRRGTKRSEREELRWSVIPNANETKVVPASAKRGTAIPCLGNGVLDSRWDFDLQFRSEIRADVFGDVGHVGKVLVAKDIKPPAKRVAAIPFVANCRKGGDSNQMIDRGHRFGVETGVATIRFIERVRSQKRKHESIFDPWT